MEDQEISEELHPAEQGAAGKFSFTIIYSHYQQYKVAASAPRLVVELG